MRPSLQGPRSKDIASGLEDDLAQIQTRAMREAVTLFRDDLRAETQAGLMSARLPKVWRMKAYPEVGASLDPAGWVYVRGPRLGAPTVGTPAAVLLDAFEKGVAISARRGGWLAIPTDAAGKRAPVPGAPTRGRGSQQARITPAGFERRTGMNLRFVPQGPAKALLVVDNAQRERSSRGSRAVPYTGRGRGAKLYGPAGRTIVVFTLLRQVRLPKRLDFTGPVQRANLRWEGLLSKHWR
ncbi:hypothetical protein CA606_18200 [Caulobacter vibrioides]|uniref:Uncharacterized protein n=1 Tax=Caulobacter vibrioides TaxID=155892 RepID=A0A290MPT6_CAUVI|nr:DUF6441 family protein [Caulobacter vibrioides]ATC34106.1 hypothetical protein CA606_18200 [Caulobacter vibrioides]